MSKLNRRIFLRGLGGAVVAAPFLGSLYSDKTEQFCGGAGAVPDAKIHSPGGFSELNA